jgi:hypothetical protein
MLKQLALITLAVDNEDRRDYVRRLIADGDGGDAERSVIDDTLPVSAWGGDLVWHLHFADQATWEDSGAFERLDALASDQAIARIDAIAYRPDLVRLTRSDMHDAVYRALIVAVEPSASPQQAQQWLAEIRRMPAYIPEIVNAATGNVIRSRGERRWTHVWEQEFASVADLRGPYMTNPYHWAFIDRWFDPEMPDRIIDTRLCHSASTSSRSVIADY